MVLSGPEIAAQLALRFIRIAPFDEKQLNPNSYDVRLADRLLVYTNVVGQGLFGEITPVLPEWAANPDYHERALDVRKDNPTTEVMIPKEGVILRPGILYLGSTIEVVGSKKHQPCLDGKSSLGRLGLSIHATAGFFDIGFLGQCTLEMTVVHPLRIHAGMRIAQISFTTVLGEIVEYAGKYQNQEGPTPSRSYQDAQE